jgi:hypothetical protein
MSRHSIVGLRCANPTYGATVLAAFFWGGLLLQPVDVQDKAYLVCRSEVVLFARLALGFRRLCHLMEIADGFPYIRGRTLNPSNSYFVVSKTGISFCILISFTVYLFR